MLAYPLPKGTGITARKILDRQFLESKIRAIYDSFHPQLESRGIQAQIFDNLDFRHIDFLRLIFINEFGFFHAEKTITSILMLCAIGAQWYQNIYLLNNLYLKYENKFYTK